VLILDLREGCPDIRRDKVSWWVEDPEEFRGPVYLKFVFFSPIFPLFCLKVKIAVPEPIRKVGRRSRRISGPRMPK
jgi:hypothetical protein